MKFPVRLLTVALIAIPAVPALAATTGTATSTATTAAVTVARYTFDGGLTSGRFAENSGRGAPLVMRTADRGTVRVGGTTTNRFVGFPYRCAAGATTCPRAILEGTDDPNLDPGTRKFTWGATIFVAKNQLAGSSNVMQKGVATTESQWKMQVGETHGKAQCVVVGRGSATPYLVRSSVAVADGKWHQIICQRNGGYLAIAVDGVQRGRVAVPATMSIANDKPLRIGGPNFNTTSDMYHGFVDNVYAVLG